MQNVPKIVRERLNAAVQVGQHLEADVLTAFAERSLPEVERVAVLDHLARCGDCRDVLALALPLPDATQTVVDPARGGWLSWPLLRWGFVAAGGVAIVSLGVLRYQRHSQPVATVAKTTNARVVASNIQPQAAVQPIAQQAAPSAAAISGGASADSSQKRLIAPAEAPQSSAQQQSSSGGIGGSVAPGQLLHGPAMPTQWQQQHVAGVQAPAAPMPSANAVHGSSSLAMSKEVPQSSQIVQVDATNQAPVNAEAQNPALPQGQDSQAQSSPPPQEPGYPSGAIGKAKPAANAQAVNAAPLQGIGGAAAQSLSGLELTQMRKVAPVLPRWTISPTGGLHRSFDQGQTWQDVDVNANYPPAAGATSLAVVAKTTPAKDDVADKKISQGPAGPLVFRAVTAMGPEVWAGGSSGVLYHSLDAGRHWTLVVPGGAALTGDIVGLEFPDPQHGKITTSTAEIWTTSDGGQTWQKQ